ncbi:uncharacterized protein LOC126191412 [Schistocerca cancellata]|uniref:uncharacterized protein LOC126191412 n=1 Tax=Schistocerca cancellata TaxID=274614 RepID=UPI0021175FFA|nr:uncharacterized protein LOC126191412 [Schistocerca cancellata]
MLALKKMSCLYILFGALEFFLILHPTLGDVHFSTLFPPIHECCASVQHEHNVKVQPVEWIVMGFAAFILGVIICVSCVKCCLEDETKSTVQLVSQQHIHQNECNLRQPVSIRASSPIPTNTARPTSHPYTATAQLVSHRHIHQNGRNLQQPVSSRASSPIPTNPESPTARPCPATAQLVSHQHTHQREHDVRQPVSSRASSPIPICPERPTAPPWPADMQLMSQQLIQLNVHGLWQSESTLTPVPVVGCPERPTAPHCSDADSPPPYEVVAPPPYEVAVASESYVLQVTYNSD